MREATGMAKVSLRSYHREIENLIEQGHIEEAVSHCKHILHSYPKCIDTYRLLGDAYLENKRFTDAEDIFTRVLSSTPDDLVSHFDMSRIREDAGDLPTAIWHMERAFEVQPSNTAIQNELRRLYGKRDGMEPPKVRLNRGALARMYARGRSLPAGYRRNPGSVGRRCPAPRLAGASGKDVPAHGARQLKPRKSAVKLSINCPTATKLT